MKKLIYPDDYINKVVCGDCLDVMKDIPDNSIDIFFTSPPYNKAGYEGFIRKKHKSDAWSRRNIDYGGKPEEDFMEEEDYQKWQVKVLNECWRVLKKDGNLFYNHKVRVAQHKASHPIEWLLKTKLIFRQQLIWDRGATPTISPIRFLPTTELIFWLTKERNQPNFCRLDNSSEVLRIKPDSNPNHPATFPEELVRKIVKHCGGDIVLDPFCGIGNTCLVAKELGRKYIGIEINLEYCDMANKRLANIPEKLERFGVGVDG